MTYHRRGHTCDGNMAYSCLPGWRSLGPHAWLFFKSLMPSVGHHHYLPVRAIQQQQRAAAVWAAQHQPGVAAGPRSEGALPLGRC